MDLVRIHLNTSSHLSELSANENDNLNLTRNDDVQSLETSPLRRDTLERNHENRLSGSADVRGSAIYHQDDSFA